MQNRNRRRATTMRPVGALVGEVIDAHEGEAAFGTVESLRPGCWPTIRGLPPHSTGGRPISMRSTRCRRGLALRELLLLTISAVTVGMRNTG